MPQRLATLLPQVLSTYLELHARASKKPVSRQNSIHPRESNPNLNTLVPHSVIPHPGSIEPLHQAVFALNRGRWHRLRENLREKGYRDVHEQDDAECY